LAAHERSWIRIGCLAALSCDIRVVRRHCVRIDTPLLLQDPDIILADEATSALDTRTEAAVIRTLCESSEGKKRTVIMIAHRLATVRNCDTIFVLNTHGHIAERGSHHELLAHRGLYHQLWSQQLDEKVHDRQITQADEMSEQPEATTTTHVAIAEDLAAVPPK
jgi:ABC-type methionine transport system ATPase subunit